MAHTVSANSQTQINLPFPIPFFGGLGGKDDEQEFEPEPEGAYGDIEWEISDLKGKDIWITEDGYEMLIGHEVTGTLFAKNPMPYSRHGTIAVDGSGKRDDAEYTTKLKPLRNTAVATFVIAEYEHQDFRGYAAAFREREGHENRLARAQDGLSDAQYNAANPGKLRDDIASEITAASNERLDSAIGSIEQQHSASRTSQEAEIRQQYADNRSAEIQKRRAENFNENYKADRDLIYNKIQDIYVGRAEPTWWKEIMYDALGETAFIPADFDPELGRFDRKDRTLRYQFKYSPNYSYMKISSCSAYGTSCPTWTGSNVTPDGPMKPDEANIIYMAYKKDIDKLRVELKQIGTASEYDDKTIKKEVEDEYSDAEDGAIDAMIEADKATEDSEIAQAGSTEVHRLDNEIAALDARDFQAEADAAVAELEYNIGNYEGFVAEQDAFILDYENALTLCDKEFPGGVSMEVFWEPEYRGGWFRKVVSDKMQYATVTASGTVSCGYL